MVGPCFDLVLCSDISVAPAGPAPGNLAPVVSSLFAPTTHVTTPRIRQEAHSSCRWRISYWYGFIAQFTILPFHQEYADSGEMRHELRSRTWRRGDTAPD